jgi:nucleotide-binding universal stress UspA family protein
MIEALTSSSLRADPEKERAMKSIIIGYDGSEHADRALDRAAAIANGATLIVVAAVPVSAYRGSPSAVDPIQAEEARKSLERAKERLQGSSAPVRTVESHGDPADALVNAAKEEGADLIVVGTRGLNFAERAVLGSISTKVVHHAHCDVLVVR